MKDTKTKTRRQLVEQARAAAMAGNWEEAVEINQQIIERFPRDAEAHNRLGRAQLELRHAPLALEAYSQALRLDPANIIARRNLQRLDLLRHRPAAEPTNGDQAAEPTNGDQATEPTIPRTSVFIEEVGKTWVDELVNPVALEELAAVAPGEQLQLLVEGNRLLVTRVDGQRLGEVEARTAERVIDLIGSGNRYEVYALGMTSKSLRVILREVYHSPTLGATVSFPRQISAARAYLRERDLLRARDEADFLFHDEDDDLDEEEASPETVEEEETTEPDTETFIEDTVTIEEEEQPI